MKIVVCIKQVPDTDNVKIDPVTKNIARESVKGVVNPFDKNAIEAAIQLKEQTGGSITVISMGPEQFKESLREALAMGCDEAILLSSKSFAGADTLATAYVLSQSIQKLGGADLVFFGRHAIDADTGQVGPIVAEYLNFPQVTFVSELSLINDNKYLQATRLFDDGKEIVKVKLPAVITVTSELNTPRYATPIKIMKAAKKIIAIHNEIDLVCDKNRIGIAGSPTIVTDIFAPAKSSMATEMISGTPEDAAKEIVSILKKQKLI